jgi:2-polyprenyl-6-methoxyphenol hydroxylase-like FAD-dependent oxidoreductase
VHAPFIAMVPQWDFLDFLAEQGRRYPAFTLIMQAEVFELIERDACIAGVRAQTPDGPVDVHAQLVVGADGGAQPSAASRGLRVEDIGAPIDVLWMRLPKQPEDAADAALGNIRNGHIFVMLDRGDYWQCAFVIQKGGYDELRRGGLDAFRAQLASIVRGLAADSTKSGHGLT